jgi:hypothetical protein
MEEEAAAAYHAYVTDGVVPVQRRRCTSSFTGVSWVKGPGKWKAMCKSKVLGYHTTEEGAAQAYENYVKDGVVPVKPSTFSHLTGVSWVKGPGKWKAHCKGKHLGLHDTEEGAAAAYDKYVADGVVPEKRPRPTSSRLQAGRCRLTPG